MRRPWLGAIAIVVIAIPFVVSESPLRAIAKLLLLLAAASGLNIAAGYAGVPSLGQGAFVGLGAYAVAILRVRAGWDPITSVLAAVVIAAAAAAIVARGVAHLKPAFVALATWIVSFAFLAAIDGFSSWSGGASGIVLPPLALRMRALGVNASVGSVPLYIVGALVASGSLMVTRLVEQRFGPAMSAMRADRSAALAAGIDVAALRKGALIASAAIGGLAGALLVQLEGVADPTAYGPLLSVKLFIVVLLGGAGSMLGPVAGMVALAILNGEASLIARAFGASSGSADALAVGLALGVLSFMRGQGIVTVLLHNKRASHGWFGAGQPTTFDGASLEVRDVSVSLGDDTVLQRISLRVASGECHAVIGPNGSGKTTLGRVIAGAQETDRGEVLIDGKNISTLSPRDRVRAGVARTLQRLWSPANQKVLDQVKAGAEAHRLPGVVRHLLRTPSASNDHDHAICAAIDALATLGMAGVRHKRVSELPVGDQRLVDIARAVASKPRVLVLDEPSAGIGADRIEPLRSAIAALNAAGLTLILIEHNLRLVADLATRVTVLDAGAVIADGSFAQIADDALVRNVYLGEP